MFTKKVPLNNLASSCLVPFIFLTHTSCSTPPAASSQVDVPEPSSPSDINVQQPLASTSEPTCKCSRAPLRLPPCAEPLDSLPWQRAFAAPLGTEVRLEAQLQLATLKPGRRQLVLRPADSQDAGDVANEQPLPDTLPIWARVRSFERQAEYSGVRTAAPLYRFWCAASQTCNCCDLRLDQDELVPVVATGSIGQKVFHLRELCAKTE